MTDSTNPLDWVARAEEDRALAGSALRRRTPITAGACFHAQQYLKATLVAGAHAFPRTHDFIALNNLCTQAGISLALNASDLLTLSAYAFQARYPGTNPTLEEARHALDIARKVRRAVRRCLNIR